ncbi:MFS transporter [Aliidiomarina taiwanensis]|uniref:MFS transporter n=1 Tax=Aliidiomarina taiwanensis TaxID=946228 RepID=A0A432WZ31_9GAMM|nr:VC0807 family protein [Aliidiomarina taiwanensis]RUO39064.1 MFS transporter [Aliidiomarina taiwanensis]
MGQPQQKQPSFLVELVFNIVIPSLILMKFSGEGVLGPVYGLIIALLFPLCYGLWDSVVRRKLNLFSVLGLVSVLLTGGIGLLELDPKYIAIKEAAIPAIIGAVVWASQYTRFPLVRTLLLNPKVMDTEKLEQHLAQHQQTDAFKHTLHRAGIGVTGSFFLSATLNYVLARMIVVSPAGTEAFNQEIGRMTALSFPVIVLPTMIILLGSIFYLFWKIKRLTGESIESFIRDKE